ncbi:MAG: dethiobiotin synthase [Legionella sp.]|nr:MAG: dethiobiotin synthase [Legionella sp.]
MNTYFIVGTDTDCGKTYVTVALLDYLRQQNQAGHALKPIASGCTKENGVLINEDIRSLQKANGVQTPSINRWLMTSAIAPHLAAKESGMTLSASEIMAFCQSYPTAGLSHLLIEGAGGLMVPLNEEETWIDFLTKSNIPVILVVGMRLGCINHALLTASVLDSHHISCTGWIANFLDPTMLAPQDNLQTLVHKLPHRLLGKLSFGGGFEPQVYPGLII